jgi:hypothetical protein
MTGFQGLHPQPNPTLARRELGVTLSQFQRHEPRAVDVLNFAKQENLAPPTN